MAASELGSPVAAESQKSDASRGSSMLRWVAGSQKSVDSGFSFEGEMNQQDARSVESDVQTEDKTKGKKTKKDRGTGAQATSAGKQCSITICEEIAAGTSPYCWCHKRAFGRFCKMAMKGKKNRTEVYVQYCEIFGEGREKPTDPALAEQVIIDTASSMHETQEEDGAKNSGSKISTAINLGQYVHSRGTRASRDNVDSDFRLDFELFVHRLKNCRGWSEKQAEAEWLKLQAMPQVGRDNDGRHHPKYGNLRLDIPPNLIGENKVENRKGKFEERRLDSMNKSAKMDEDTKKNWLTQTDSGFDMIRLQEGLDEAMNQPLSASSLASEFDFEAAGEKILASAAALANKETGDDSKDGEGSAKKRQAGSEHPDSSPAKGPKKGDVSSTRSALWAKARDTLESGKSNVVAEMVKAAAALRQVEKDQHGQVFVAPVRQRFEICKHFTGMTEKAVGSSNADKAAPPVFEDFLYQEAEEAKRGDAQRKALREAIAACDINPLESATTMANVSVEIAAAGDASVTVQVVVQVAVPPQEPADEPQPPQEPADEPQPPQPADDASSGPPSLFSNSDDSPASTPRADLGPTSLGSATRRPRTITRFAALEAVAAEPPPQPQPHAPPQHEDFEAQDEDAEPQLPTPSASCDFGVTLHSTITGSCSQTLTRRRAIGTWP